MKRDFNAWLASLGPAAPVKTLTELREWNTAHEKMGAIKYGQSQLDASDKIDLEKDRAKYEEDRARDIRVYGTNGIDAAVKANNLDALLFPGPASAGIASKPGYPTVLVPFGMIPNAPGNFGGGRWRSRRWRRGRAGRRDRHHDAARGPRRHAADRAGDRDDAAGGARRSGAVSARLRSEAAALRRRLHRPGLQRAEAAAAGVLLRAGDEEADAAAGTALKLADPETVGSWQICRVTRRPCRSRRIRPVRLPLVAVRLR